MPNQLSIETLPPYLARYCTEQDESKYTSQDHAAWRYIMRQSSHFFKDAAVPIYLDGLKKTGIPFDRIPRIADMDRALQEFGWGAVPVCGFIPPIAFLDLQARKVLPIATDMRSLAHISYTPAPDIVHEAAGHAPIIADAAYRNYLTRYAVVAQKTIMSREDLNLYEAIRVLSDIKENPDTQPGEIAAAQKKLDEAVKCVSYVSEAAKVSRMAWWTVEYGLVGPLANPKIYGAGLLSSVQESQNFRSPAVRKVPLTVKCVDTSYDITEPQPQLFVAETLDQLTDVLKDLEGLLSYKLGGVKGLEEARKAQTVNTGVLDSGLQISGQFDRYEATVDGAGGQVAFVALTGPVQLSYQDRELTDQGRLRHAHGFSCPLGRWVGQTQAAAFKLSDEDLKSFGLHKGKVCELRFENGFKVKGRLDRIVRNDKKDILYFTWSDCTVTRGEKVYFEPSWGEFDMPVGSDIVSVFGGPADRDAYGQYDMGGVSTQPGRQTPFTELEMRQFDAYNKIALYRNSNAASSVDDFVQSFLDQNDKTPLDWLMHLELLELVLGHSGSLQHRFKLEKGLEAFVAKESDQRIKDSIVKGLLLASAGDVQLFQN
jgi:phenylalanine-4-hydroxylase